MVQVEHSMLCRSTLAGSQAPLHRRFAPLPSPLKGGRVRLRSVVFCLYSVMKCRDSRAVSASIIQSSNWATGASIQMMAVWPSTSVTYHRC